MYSNHTPLEMLDNKEDFDAYGEVSYLDLEVFVIDALIKKLADLQVIFDTTEVHPGLAATFNGVHMNTSDGPLPVTNISFSYTKSTDSTVWTGLRVFENTSSTAAEDVFVQYLNPFSKQWHDYYLTNLMMAGNGWFNLTLGFNDTPKSASDIKSRNETAIFSYDMSYLTTVSSPTPLPATNINYRPVAPFFKSLRTVSLDRNVFSKTWNKAHVNFSYMSPSNVIKNDSFKVQVKAQVRVISSIPVIGIISAVESLLLGEVQGPTNFRDLTGIIEVVDNGKNDNDPSVGKVSVNVSLDLNKLKTRFLGLYIYDTSPILEICVWKASDFKAVLNEALLESVSEERHLYSAVPTIQINEQGYFSFDNTEDPVIGAYDVGEGDKEVAVPFEIYMEDVLGSPLVTFNPFSATGMDWSAFIYPRDDPRLGTVYNLTCKFVVIRDIPSDSAIVANKGILFLVDFDNGHLWMRDMHLNMLLAQKGLGELEEFIFSGLLPRLTAENVYKRLLLPSEYKFALTYEFIPIYIQYFKGYQPETALGDVTSGKDFVITVGSSKNPSLENIPYRVVPLNINRGNLARSLWYDVKTEMEDGNYSMDYFIYDIIGTIMREISDIAGMFEFGSGGTDKTFNVLNFANATKDILKFIQKFVGYYKAVDDGLKGIKKDNKNMGTVRLSTPGAMDKLDLGAFFYLGFDVGRNTTMDDARASMDHLTWMLFGVGLWSDFKTQVKMAKEIMKFFGMFQETGEFKGEELVKRFQGLAKNYGTYSTIALKYYKLATPGGGKGAKKFLPAALFMVQQQYGMTDEQLRENGELARAVGYSIVDVSLLRQRNKMSLGEIRNFSDTFKLKSGELHGLTCIVDLTINDFIELNSVQYWLNFPLSSICDYNKRAKFSEWRVLIDLALKGIPSETLKIAAQISLPYIVLQKCLDYSIDPYSFAIRAKAVKDTTGFASLTMRLKDHPEELDIIDAAYDLKDWSTLIIMPNGDFGPDLYIEGRLVFVYHMMANASRSEDAKAFIDKAQKTAISLSNDHSYVYYDLRFAKGMKFETFNHELVAHTTTTNDETGIIDYHVVLGQNMTMYLMRRGPDFIGMSGLPEEPG